MPTRNYIWSRWLLLATNIGLPLRMLIFGVTPGWLLMELVAHGLMFYAFVAPGCGWIVPVVSRFRTTKKEVWLTIDDGPIAGKTAELSLELAKRKCPATFFLIGNRLALDPEITTRLAKDGHSAANHTASHALGTFWSFPPRVLAREIDNCQALLDHLQKPGNRWFRTPFGVKNLFLATALATRKMRLIAWSLRAHDGLFCHPPRVIRRIVDRAKAGDIILMHERRSENMEAILGVVEELQSRGFAFVVPTEKQWMAG